MTDNLLRVKEKIGKREDRLLRLKVIIDAAKLCAELEHFDMANKLISEFDELCKKE
jgi:hypothetical protein